MEKVVLKATKREVVGKQVGALRRSGKLPAVIYGRHRTHRHRMPTLRAWR
jgi:large subunit ribosomal protein L25